MAKGEQERVGFFGRLKQIGMVFKFTAKQDKWFLPWVAAAVLVPLSLTVLAVALGLGWIWIPLGIMLTLLAVLIVLNVRASKVYMRLPEHQPRGCRVRCSHSPALLFLRSRFPCGWPRSPDPSPQPRPALAHRSS